MSVAMKNTRPLTHTNTAAEIHWMNVRSFAKKVFGSTLLGHNDSKHRARARSHAAEAPQNRQKHNKAACTSRVSVSASARSRCTCCAPRLTFLLCRASGALECLLMITLAPWISPTAGRQRTASSAYRATATSGERATGVVAPLQRMIVTAPRSVLGAPLPPSLPSSIGFPVRANNSSLLFFFELSCLCF